MKNEIIKITKDLEQGEIDLNMARNLLMGLFDVSGSLPTDEEIEKVAKGYDNSMSSMAESIWMPEGFKEGAKWMRKKLTGQ